MNLIPAGQTTVRYADGRSATREMVNNVWLCLLGREGVFSAIIEPDRETALIGAIVLEELDLVVDSNRYSSQTCRLSRQFDDGRQIATCCSPS